MNRGKTYNCRVLVVISLGVQCYVGYNMIVLMNISNIASSGFQSFQHLEMHVLDDEIKTGKCHIDVYTFALLVVNYSYLRAHALALLGEYLTLTAWIYTYIVFIVEPTLGRTTQVGNIQSVPGNLKSASPVGHA
ncbi:hypothetical protein IFM89_037980 [Coptis chinensis]|uniref:Uncharacterized protein n=1 Tax=Coptis chinensis TaxID=261450 RepID=A0A835I6C3_9MAGN|nr:hypothetical protein IFM89_037980 [Coptis chinensis]